MGDGAFADKPTSLAYFSSTPARRSGVRGTWAARRAASSASGIRRSMERAMQSMRIAVCSHVHSQRPVPTILSFIPRTSSVVGARVASPCLIVRRIAMRPSRIASAETGTV